ncbi:hypothetical protein EC988_004195, partial [Linderina pennispora]
KVSTRTAIGSLAEAGSPTCESAPASAFGTVNSSVSLKSMDDPNRFSVEAFKQQGKSRFSMMTINTVAARDVGVMPNAVEIMRAKTEDPVKPKLFLDDQADSEILGEPDSRRHSAVMAEVEDTPEKPDSAQQSCGSSDILSAVGNSSSSSNSNRRSTMKQGVKVPLIADPSIMLAGDVAVQAPQTEETKQEEEKEEDETPAEGTPVSEKAPSFDFSVGSDEFGFASAVYAAAQKVLRAKDWDDGSGPEPAPGSTLQVEEGGEEAGEEGSTRLSTIRSFDFDTAGKPREAGLDVASAIGELAPAERRPASSKGSMDSGKAQRFIGSMEFFDSSPGPELATGMLAGDPALLNALSFDVPGSSGNNGDAEALAPERSLTDRSIRRSMSMPDTSADSLSARRRFDTEPAMRSQQMVVQGRIAHMSPRSVISAVSSASRFGGSKAGGGGGGGGVLRSLSHRLTSWFTKKN